MIKRLTTIILSAILAAVLIVPTSALAADDTHAAMQPDYSKTGSIAVDIETAKGTKVGGGELTAYMVAEAVYDDGDNIFQLTTEFAGSGLEISSIESEEQGAPKLAADFAAYVEANGIAGKAAAVDSSGHAQFTDLKLGLYLIVQTTAADEYEPISPFLITVPLWDGEQLVYDINARPKPGTALGMAKYDPPLEKLVIEKNGAASEDDEFVFRMLPGDPSYPMPVNDDAVYDETTGALTKTIHGPGSYEFGWMYFGLEDVGKTYTYKVFEVAGDDAHYSYDTIVYYMTIVVSQNEEEVILDVSYSDPEGRSVDEVKFNNIYDEGESGGEGEPEPEEPEKLPQTGQLWWPVPLLGALGIALVVLGLIRRSRSNGK